MTATKPGFKRFRTAFGNPLFQRAGWHTSKAFLQREAKFYRGTGAMARVVSEAREGKKGYALYVDISGGKMKRYFKSIP